MKLPPPPPPEALLPARLRLRVTATAETILRTGHPWLFAESIREQNRPGRLGELAVIFDRKDQFLGIGLFDSQSPLRVRMLHAGKPLTLDAAWWSARFRAAWERRAALIDAQTTGCRCLHGENDGWPGLVLDRYGSVLVLKLYSSAWLPRLGLGSMERGPLPAGSPVPPSPQASYEPNLMALLDGGGACGLDATGARVLRLSRNIQDFARETFGLTDGQMLSGNVPAGGVTFLENGLRFEADVRRGQKTGFFLDQRENRRRVGALAEGRDVLNAFSFSGGFSLYAARGGAKSVTDIDISAHALASAARNVALNQAIPAVAACRHACVQADAFAWLGEKPTRLFGLIVLDPPSLAKRETDRAGAIQAYGRLNASAIRWLAPGGVLVAASCSAHVTAPEFFGAVRHAVAASGRPGVELQTSGHPVDHPATFREGEYLKAIYFRFGK